MTRDKPLKRWQKSLQFATGVSALFNSYSQYSFESFFTPGGSLLSWFPILQHARSSTNLRKKKNFSTVKEKKQLSLFTSFFCSQFSCSFSQWFEAGVIMSRTDICFVFKFTFVAFIIVWKWRVFDCVCWDDDACFVSVFPSIMFKRWGVSLLALIRVLCLLFVLWTI